MDDDDGGDGDGDGDGDDDDDDGDDDDDYYYYYYYYKDDGETDNGENDNGENDNGDDDAGGGDGGEKRTMMVMMMMMMCEPAQLKCTWTCHHWHFLRTFTGNVPNAPDTTSIEHRALTVTVRTPQCGHTVWPKKIEYR